jgi:predicted metal-dependent phosphoesterase TrpH
MFRFDTHVHTSEVSPCGQIRAEETVRLYVEAGFYGICITDHYYRKSFDTWKYLSWDETIERYLEGYHKAKKAGEKNGLDVLLGAEVMFDGSPNEYLLYGITEDFLCRYPRLYEYAVRDFRKIATENGILIFQAHPFRNKLTRENPAYLDGVEIVNGNLRHDSHNELAVAYAQTNGLAPLGGSDCHKIEDVGKSGIITAERIENSQILKKVLLSHRYEVIPL